MKIRALVAFLLVVPYYITAAGSAFANPQSDSNDITAKIELRIFPKTRVVKSGNPLELRVEIWNVGDKDVFIEKTIYELCAHSPLSLSLELGPPIKSEPGYGCAADCADVPNESFSARLVQRWIPLSRGHFYGTTVRMYPSNFPQLRTPGRWRLSGSYGANGDMSASFCVFSAKRLDPEETAKLPYRAWRGKINSDAVWIEVVPIGAPARKK